MAETSLSIRDLQSVFVDDPQTGREQLRQLKSQEHGEFLRQAIHHLENGPNNSFSQVLLQMCREESSNLKSMLFTADLLSLDEAARLVRLSSKNDASFQVHLLASVKGEIDKSGSTIPNREFIRLLEILAKSVDLERLGGMLASLCEHPDDRLRSKVALLSGSLVRHLPKRMDLLKDIDPRVRANAVESLWGRRDAESIQILKDASVDAHHRIAANGLLGLYLAGEVCSIRGILKLSRDADLSRQLAGIWVLGQTKDPRFHTVIRENLSVTTGRVKFGMMSSGRKIRKRIDELHLSEALSAQVIYLERTDKGRVRLSFALKNRQGDHLKASELLGTQVLIQDGDLKVDQYYFEPRGAATEAHVACLMPLRTGVSNAVAAELVRAMESAIDQKRPDDAWKIQKYRLDGESSGAEGNPAPFEAQASVLRAEHLRSVKAFSSVTVAVEQMLTQFPPTASHKHLVLVMDPEIDRAYCPPDTWAELFQRHGVTLHVVMAGELDAEAAAGWRQLSQARRGLWIEAHQAGQLPEALAQVVQALQPHFYVTYQLGRSLPNSDPLEQILFEFIPESGYGRILIRGSQVQTVTLDS